MDLADYAMSMTPAQRQALMAEMIRARQQSAGGEQIAAANKRAHGLDLLAATGMMANNPAVAAASQYAAKQRQAQEKPVQMGNTGFMLPGQGEFVDSPMYTEEKRLGREARRDASEQQYQSRMDTARMRAEQEEQNRVLRRTLAAEAEAGRHERAQERNALLLTLAGLRGGNSAEAAAERRAAAEEKRRNTDLQKFTASMDKGGIPEFESALGIVEQNLNKYPAGKLPGFGRIASLKPNMIATDEEQGVRADMQQAANILLKSRSGAAVTEGEMRRFLQEVAMGNFMDETTLRRGWSNVRKTFEGKKGNILSSVPADVLDVYNERSGTKYQQGGPTNVGATPPAKGKIEILSVRPDK